MLLIRIEGGHVEGLSLVTELKLRPGLVAILEALADYCILWEISEIPMAGFSCFGQGAPTHPPAYTPSSLAMFDAVAGCTAVGEDG